MSAIIVAGGQSLRMGRDKAFVKLDGKRLLDRVLDALPPSAGTVIISANDPRMYEEYQARGIIVVPDPLPEQGPLVGLLAGLDAIDDDAALALSCDAPFLSTSLLEHLLAACQAHDAAVTITTGRIHPLLSAYKKACVPAIRRHIARGDRKVDSFYGDVDVYWVDEEEMKIYDPELASSYNVNTESDLKKAQEYLRAI